MLCASILVFTSCEETSESPIEELSFQSITIPSQYDGNSLRLSSEVETYEVMLVATDEDGNEVEGLARVTMPVDNDNVLVNFEVTTNIMEVANLDSDFWVNSTSASQRLENHGDCLSKCEDVKRTGWCKAGCWTELGLKVVGTIVVIAVL